MLLGTDKPQTWKGCRMFGSLISRSSPIIPGIWSSHRQCLLSKTQQQTPNGFLSLWALPRHRHPPPPTSPSLNLQPVLLFTTEVSQQLGADLPEQPGVTADRQADMRLGLAALMCLFSSVLLSDCAPPTCYSRAVSLSKEVMTLLDKIHTYHRTVRAQPHSHSPRWVTIWDWCYVFSNDGVVSGCRKRVLRFYLRSSSMCT